MSFDILWTFGKYTLLLILVALGYLLYIFVIKILMIRNYFKKYPNVYVTEKFTPMIGDAKYYRENIKLGRAKHYHQIEFGMNLKGYDFRLSCMGTMAFMNIVSFKAMKEFERLVPEYIDRRSLAKINFGKICPESMMHEKTTSNWKKRREALLKHVGLNFASKYIPNMIDALFDKVEGWQEGKKYNMGIEMNQVTFKVITMILFGKDVNEQVGMINYIKQDKTVIQYSFSDYFIYICKDLMSTAGKLVPLIAPFISQNSLIEPWKTNDKNVEELFKVLKKYLKNCTDQNSVYYQLTKVQGFDEEETFHDVMGLLFAGHETSSHTLTSAFYFLSKYPETKVKLQKEIAEFKGKSREEFKQILTKDKINDLDYLYQVVKECLRIDPPAVDSLSYEANRNVKFCGVDFKKGQRFNVHVLGAHYNSDEWKDPLKFIPERFDPESDYYVTPAGKNRNPRSWIPFSIHLRNCPGQTLALLEVKVIILTLLSITGYKIDQNVLDDNYTYFTLGSQNQLEFEPLKLQ